MPPIPPSTPLQGLRDDGINLGSVPGHLMYVLWKVRVYDYVGLTYGVSNPQLLEIDNGFWQGETTGPQEAWPNRAAGRDKVVEILNEWIPGER